MSLPARRRLLAAAALAVVAVVALLAWRARPGGHDAPTAVARRGELVVDVATTGQLEAVRSRVVGRPRSATSWNAAKLAELAPEGSFVKAGDFLAQLDMTDAQRELEEARNALLNARAELERQKATSAAKLAELESAVLNQQYGLEQVRLRLEAMKFEAEVRRREQELELRKAELAMQDANDRLAAQRVIAQAEQSKAEFEVRRAQMLVAQAEEALAALRIVAPDSGLVVHKSFRGGKVKVGDQVWPGMDIIELPDLSSMQVRTRVNEVDVRLVETGQEVVVTVDALAGRQLRGRVTRIATLARAEGEAKVKVFDVDVLVEGGDGELRPGMTAQCRIVVARLPDVVTVPIEAVFERDGRSVVFVGREERVVTLGRRNDDFVVIESGLAAGQAVALRDPRAPSAPAARADGEVAP